MPSPPLTPRTSPPPLAAVFRRVVTAMRANLLPALALQTFAVLLGLAYFLVPAVHDGLWRVGEIKNQIGWPFALVSTACFGGLLPWLIQSLRPGKHRAAPGELLFLLAFWGLKGVEIDLLYRAQAWLWGTGTDVTTVAAKVVVDQLIYVPLWAVPTMALAYGWKNTGYRIQPVLASMRHHWIRREGLLLLIPNWAIWIPAVVVIYLLPLPLQLPVQNLVLCFFSLLLLFLTRPEPASEPASSRSRLEESPA